MNLTCDRLGIMRSALGHILLMAVWGGLLVGMSKPVVAAEPDKVANWVLTKVRVLPKTGDAAALTGARITGSNLNATNGFVELAKISETPKDNTWIEVPVQTTEVYRYVKLEAASGALLAVAELEFFAGDRKLTGLAFGTDTGKDGKDHDANKAFDGDPNTAFKAPITDGYVGLDLGNDCMANQPRFEPGAGAYEQPQTVTVHVWPRGAIARYTTDGSPPSRTHGEFAQLDQKITIDHNMSLAIMSYQQGKADSNVAVVNYLIGAGQKLPALVKTYHIGNSLTDTVKGVLDAVAMSGGKNLLTQFKTIPGISIGGNWKANGQGFGYPVGAAKDYEKVLAAKVDHLFLQPFPNPPGLWRDGEYGGKFIALARQANPDVQPWLYAQWIAYPVFNPDGKLAASYCNQIGGQSWDPEEKIAWLPPIPAAKVKTWDDAMVNTMDYYRAILKEWDALPGNKPVLMVPGGPALVRLKKEITDSKFPGVTDFPSFTFSDHIHLTAAGRYLISLVHYACIYRESPEGKVTWANSGVSKEQALVLQHLAWETVLAEPASGVKD